MSGLKGLAPPTRGIRVGDGVVTVRGLAFDEITNLLMRFGDGLDSIEKMFTDAESIETAAIFDRLMRDAPGVVHAAIAMASDEPEETDTVRRLGAGFALEALIAIWELTTQPAGGGKKFLGHFVQMWSAARNSLPAPPDPEQSGEAARTH